ncbi:gem-associated protein 5-like [Cydia pomonella]|uniref:gem-associated protein 5-like n=1 Tax=Cydia pomonella TaxID=82600 RepID=UPI002ADDE3E0|nr:gem-associated protein 5-like [Cydia pomonella]
MDETVLFPSPNWFQVSGLAVSNDGWLAYGGPSKSLCVLKPVPADANGVVVGAEQYTAHVLNRAHPDKIVSVDISPEWPERKLVLTGSSSGSVKQWSLEDANGGIKFKSNLSHDIHTHEKEEIVGVAYSNEVYAVTVGCFGNIVKWDLNANVVKTFNNMLKTFKPTCMTCSHHITLNVAIGTKQGVLFVVDLNGAGNLIYKVRSQDDEIMNVSWCPQYEVQVEKSVDESQRFGIVTDKTIKSKSKKGAAQKESQKSSASDRMEKIRQQLDLEENYTSGIKKDLPQDSFEDFVVVPDDDMFDIYKDHEADEFGHKKYEPEDILVKIKEPKEQNDYLAECLKLKDAILKKKNEPEPSIESLVEALEKSDINSESCPKGELPSGSKIMSDASQEETTPSKDEQEEPSSVSSVHMHKHLLATIGKQGGVRIWSKTGKLVASCALKQQQGRFRNSWATLAWCQPELLLIADGKNQLLECNPLKPDCKNKLETKLVHTLHKRGLHCVATNAWRASAAAPVAWSVSQDRSLVRYSLCDRSTTVYNTCGGFIYNVQYCPYDVNKVAVSVGDGAVRVWSAEEAAHAEGRLAAGRVATYWQHVQGKVLTVAWHPTRENLLAFGTAESRVGLIEAGSDERPARALGSGLAGGVYALGWGAARLYAAARQELRAYCQERPDEPGTPVPVSVEGAAWGVSAVRVRGGLMCVGSDAGGVAVLREQGARLLAATFVGSKIIHTIEWHPQQTSFSNEESQHKNLIAVCSQDKANSVVILEFVDKEENHPKLIEFKKLTGHTNTVLQLAWSPHHEMKLLSTSHDGTVRVWDVEAGTCVSIFGGHGGTTLGAAWVAQPCLPHHVLSGGADCCLRLWDTRRHPAEAYRETQELAPKKDKKKKKDKKEIKTEATKDTETADCESNGLATLESTVKISKKFLLPTITKQMQKPKTKGAKRMLHKFMVKKNLETEVEETEEYDLDYIKMFGNSKEVNELFDMEMEHHLRVGNTESWLVLCVLRGHIDAALRLAAERDLLCPYLLSLAPGVSTKYWKDASKSYLAQLDRLVANGEEDKLVVNKNYGGPVYRKVLTLLSLQDAIGAVKTLVENKLYKEAYMLCRIRYMDTIGDEVLESWAKNCLQSGVFDMAAVCHLALGNLLEAATCLGQCLDAGSLRLAAAAARAAGQTILADNLMGRTLNTEDVAADLDRLPSRAELFLQGTQSDGAQHNGDDGNGRDHDE